MDLQELHKKLQEIKELKEQGKTPEAVALLHDVQKELRAHPVKSPDKNNLKSKNVYFCEECGKEGNYEEQECLCDFCYTARYNLGQGSGSISQEEMDEERFDNFIKESEKSNDE